jgi:hypothetical protein
MISVLSPSTMSASTAIKEYVLSKPFQVLINKGSIRVQLDKDEFEKFSVFGRFPSWKTKFVFKFEHSGDIVYVEKPPIEIICYENAFFFLGLDKNELKVVKETFLVQSSQCFVFLTIEFFNEEDDRVQLNGRIVRM